MAIIDHHGPFISTFCNIDRLSEILYQPLPQNAVILQVGLKLAIVWYQIP